MHSAPSVIYPVGRCFFVAALYTIFIVFTSAIGAGWAFYQPVGLTMRCAACLFLVAALLGWRQLRWRARLIWHDQSWVLQAASGKPMQGQLKVGLDLQHVLLLRFKPIGEGVMSEKWLWLERRAQASDWQDVRRAAYAHDQRVKKEAL